MRDMAPQDVPAPDAQPGRVAFVAPLYPLLTETFVYREALGLEARGWQVHAISLYPVPAERRPDGVADAELVVADSGLRRTLARALAELVTHPLRSLATLGTGLADAVSPREPTPLARRLNVVGLSVLALGTARWLRPRAVSHVHAHFANGPGTLAMYTALHLGLPFSFVGHANDLFDRRSLLVRKLERAAFVSCISEWHRRWYLSQLDAPERCAVIRCGVDVAAWRGPEPSARGGGPLRVLSVARLIEKKGLDVLILALARAGARSELDWRLELVGDGPERQPLEALAVELGCSDRVAFPGALANDRVRARMADADLFVLPCRTNRLGDQDGIPVVLMEAMACGLPVVTGDLPSIRELVVPDETGVAVAPDDPDALAERIVGLAQNPDARRRFAIAGRKRVEEEFSLATNLDRLEARLRGTRCREDAA